MVEHRPEYASSQLTWHLVRNYNCYLKRNLNNTWFSAEPGNLAARHSYKWSGMMRVHAGIANRNDLSVKPVFDEEEMGVEVRMCTKAGKTVKFVNKSKSSRRVIEATGKQVASYRPDLKKSAMSAAGTSAAAVYRARSEIAGDE